MAGDHRIVISSEPTVSPDEIAAKGFSTSFRGYDPSEVRTWLTRVAKELRTARERERELQRQLERAQDVAAHPALDEATLTAALGEETARVLRSAREAATDITMKAEEKAARLLRETQDTANRVRTETEQFVAQRMDEANQSATAIVRAGEADADGLRAQAKADADAEIESARARGKEMVAEAMAVRERVLADLSRRRRLAHAQLEQLRAGRERLLEAYRLVRRTLDEVTAELTVAEAEARAAADTAARRAAAEATASADDLEAELALARDVDLPALDLGSTSALEQTPASLPAPAVPPGMPAWPAASLVADEPVPGDRPDSGSRLVEVVGAAEAIAEAAPEEPEGHPADVPADASADAETAATDAETWKGERRRSSSLRLLRRVRPETPAGEPQLVVVDAPDPSEAVRVVPASREPGEPTAEPDAEGAGAGAPEAAAAVEQAPDPGGHAVDDLFARIRAERERADDTVALEGEAGSAEAETEAETDIAPPVAVVDDAAPASPQDDDEGEGAASADDVGEVAADAADDDATPVSADPDADESARGRRDALLDPIESTLVRRLKRALQDEQNEVLDRLRTHRGQRTIDVILPAAPGAGRYGEVGAPALADAFRAGVTFSGGDPGVVGSPGGDRVEALVAQIAGPLRERVGRALDEASQSGLDDDDLVERVNAAYRETKLERVERAARDAVTAAFCAGSFAVTPDGAMLRWVVDSDGESCPDAHDNALAGATCKGDPYPTGQVHPPAHAGCRCLLVPFAQ